MPTLGGKVAVVTGGALGIGKAIALRFAAEGASVAIWDINQDEAQSVEAEIKKAGGTSLTVMADVGTRSEVASALEQTTKEFGYVDILVNNVGIFSAFNFLDIPEESWNEMLRVNLTSAFSCSQLVAQNMIDGKREGRIINIGSVDGGIPYEGFAHYNVSKAGMRMLSQASSLGLAKHKITVNEIAPGFILTEMSRSVIETDVFAERVGSFAPLARVGTTDEVASAALFLASSEASYITGSVLTIDGGSVIAGRSWIQQRYFVQDGFLPE
jgi:NAD(P)-dependent dehydrogenase (short-subunit alcohol dehydrogenase family)